MDSLKNFRDPFEALEQQAEPLTHQPQALEAQPRTVERRPRRRHGLTWVAVGLVCLALAFAFVHAAQAPAVPAPVKAQIQERYGMLPLSFEANQGQMDRSVKFLSRGQGYTLFLSATELTLVLKKPQVHSMGPSVAKRDPSQQVNAAVLQMQLVGANPAPQVSGHAQLPGRVNYLIGKDPVNWRPHVPTYAKVAYSGVYPGIDLVYYGNQRHLEYDFVVAPGADPHLIRLAVQGATRLEVDAAGELVLHTATGDIRMHKPVMYQQVKGVRHPIAGGYVLKAPHEVRFEVAAYDSSRPLVIDPVLSYSTYLGGNGDESGSDIAVDLTGHAYVVGTTASTDFPTLHPLQPANGGQTDVFVTKLNRDGSAILYSTYLGGSDADEGSGIAVDLLGNASITGITASPNFPTAHAFQPQHAGQFDAFVTKLNHDGSALVYSTYLGGSGDETDVFRSRSNIAVDLQGHAYVVGTTTSTDFPTTAGAFQDLLKGSNDAFVAKLDHDGSGLVYATYLGGSGVENGLSIAVDILGNAYVAGTMFFSTDFPTTPGAFQTVCGSDVIVTKLNRDGSGLVYSTCLGGSDFDFAGAIAVSVTGFAHVTGNTVSADFPTVNALQSTYGGGRDAFVTKFNRAGSGVIYSTYLGGSESEGGDDIAVDGRGNAYLTGGTLSPNFPTAHPIQATCHVNAAGDCWDAFVAKLNSIGSTLSFSTFLGGSAADSGHGIAVDVVGNVYVTGDTFDTNDFPTVNPIQAIRGGGRTDAFVAKIRELRHF